MAMARSRRDAALHEGGRAVIARKAWRLSAWGAIAFLSLAAATLTAYTETGGRRLALGETAAISHAARIPGADSDTRRLAEAVSVLTADRDRLAARVSALERNLDDVTGSIQSRSAPERRSVTNPGASPLPPDLAAAPAARPPGVAGPATPPSPTPVIQAATPAVAARAPVLAPIAADSGAAASTATRTEFGIDVGTATTVEGLRNLWNALKGTQAPLLEGLRPVVAVREGGKPGAPELRLVAGPLANAGIAARLCAALADAGVSCAPAIFDGQRLALN